MDPSDKVAVITGGASGIGLATAKLLVTRGARVVLADVQVEAGEAAARSLGTDALFCPTDVTKRTELQSLLDYAGAQFGLVDICYNNAGVNEGGQNFLDPSSDYWRRTVEIDLIAVMQATQLEVAYLRKQGGGGVIVNTASMGGIVPMPTSPIYAAAKAGVIQFSRSLGYLGQEGIRVNAICPTFTDTPMVRAGGEPAMEHMRKEVGGILQPEQVAEGVLELIRDDSRAGAVMRVTVRNGIDYTFERS